MRRGDYLLPFRGDRDQELSPFPPGGLFGHGATSRWQMMRRMQEDMDRVFAQFLAPVGQQMQQWSPSVDVSQTDQEWLVEADLPGVNKDQIDVEVREHHLILRANMSQEQETPSGEGKQERQYQQRERRYGFFERVIPLPKNVDEENIRCDFQDGVLKIHLPKGAEQQNVRRIPIGAGGGARSQIEAGPAQHQEDEHDSQANGRGKKKAPAMAKAA